MDQLDENTRLTREIHIALVGRPEYKLVGLIDRVERLEKSDKKRERLMLKATGAMIAMTVVWEVIKDKFFGGKP